jgi:hypothetical protein
MGGAGSVILFVCFFVGCAVWSMIYLTFAAHYFLATIIDSSSGQDEVHYPNEGVIDWWWKPLLCLWILGFWVITGSVLLTPLLAFSPTAYLACLGLLLWFMYPPSLMSALFTSNWLFFLHPVVLWRMLKHYGAFAYVHVITLLSVSVCVGLLAAMFTQSFVWALPAAFVIPTAQFFYARNWGRFAWLSLNFAPRQQKVPRSPYRDPPDAKAPFDPQPEKIPEMAVREVDEASQGIHVGLPPTYPHPHGIQAGVPASPDGIIAGLPPVPVREEEEDEWAVSKKPYGIVGEEAQPDFPEPAPTPASAAASLPPAVVEEEDEWATNKKPYGYVEEPAPTADPTQSEANRPVTVSRYYEQRHKKEKADKEKRERESQQNFMPTPSKKTPTFSTALFFGVWEFMVYRRTLHVWANLVVLTIVELFFLMMVVQFWPKLD